MKKLLYIYLIIFGGFSSLLAQTIDTAIIADKYWGINKYQAITSDTLLLKKQDSLQNLFNPPLSGGFMFKSDGTFNIFIKKHCGNTPKIDRSGTWKLEGQSIIVTRKSLGNISFKIIDINNEGLLVIYSEE